MNNLDLLRPCKGILFTVLNMLNFVYTALSLIARTFFAKYKYSMLLYHREYNK